MKNHKIQITPFDAKSNLYFSLFIFHCSLFIFHFSFTVSVFLLPSGCPSLTAQASR